MYKICLNVKLKEPQNVESANPPWRFQHPQPFIELPKDHQHSEWSGTGKLPLNLTGLSSAPHHQPTSTEDITHSPLETY